MPTLRLNCFQSTQVWLNDQPLTHFPRVKAQALLIYLAVEQDRPHPRNALAGLQWPDSPEPRARRNLSQTLMDLRRTLGDAGVDAPNDPPLLLSTNQTIALNPDCDQSVDVTTFARAISDSDYTQAVDLYRGPFLADFEIADSDLFESWVLTQRENLQRRALDAFRKLSREHEQNGELDQARQVVERLLVMAPWQEEAHAQLMRLLALSGERSAALAQYDTLSQMLMDELGVSPSEETNDLYDQILAGEIEVGESPIQAAVVMPRAPFQVTAASPHFVGREDEIEQMNELLFQPDTQVVALVGMGGLGKTTLATQVAHGVRDQFPDGVLWANPTISSMMDILDNWGKAYGYDFSGLSDIESRGAAVRGVLAEKSALLVLDNVTHASQVKPLLASGERIPLLLTTRDLDVAHALNAAVVPLAELSEESGRELLINILGIERIQAEEDAAAKICAQLHHLPLAVEIAAQRLKSRGRMSLSQMAQRLGDTSQRLGLKISDQAVRTSFEVSWDALDEALQAFFPLLAVFEGRPFTAEALAYVAEMDAYNVEDLLYGLNALSLVNEDEAAYFRQHPLLADFAEEKLSNAESAYGRLVEYYLAFAQENQQTYNLLEPEWGNILAAIEAANRLGSWAQVLAFTNALSQTWLTRARYAEARQAYALAEGAAAKLGDEDAQAKTLLRWGEVCVEQNDYDEASQLLDESLQLAYAHESDKLVANANYHLGRVALERNQYDNAEKMFAQSLSLRQLLKQPLEIAMVFYYQALLRYTLDDFSEANVLVQKTLDILSESELYEQKIPALRLLAQIYYQMGEFSQAKSYGEEAKKICEQHYNESELATTLYALTAIYSSLNQYEMAKQCAETGITLFRRAGLRRLEAMLLFQQSRVYMEIKEEHSALTSVQESIRLFHEVQDDLGRAYSLLHLGDLYHNFGELDKGAAAWQQVNEISDILGHDALFEAFAKRIDKSDTM